MPTTPLNTPSADLLSITSSSTAAALGDVALAGVSKSPSASDHVHQIPAMTGDVTKIAGVQDTVVGKIRGKTVTSAVPSSGDILQWDGSEIVWGSAPAGGSGGGGVTLFFNNGTTADTPVIGLPGLPNGVLYKELRKVAEPVGTTLTSGPLTASYSNIAGFITDVNDPKTTEITAGLWDFNLWAQSNDADTTLRATLFKYNGITASSSILAVSAAVTVGLTLDQHVFSLILPQTSILETDRICIVFEAANAGNSHTVTLSFGNTTPSHTHSTIASVGGSGVVKVVSGVMQSNASKIINDDIDSSAAISQSKIDGLTTSLSGKVGTNDTIAIAKGGTGATTRQDAMDALAGATTSGQFLRGNGTDVVMSTIQVSDVPVLNQSTTGTAANVTGTVAIVNGGTGATTQQAAINALAGTQVSGRYLRSNGTNTSLSSIQAADVPVLNQSTTGTAANVTGTVAIVNGGTGATTKADAFNALSPITAVGDLIIGNGASSAAALTIGTNGKVLTSNGTTATWETPAAGGGVTTIANGGTGVTTQEQARGVMGGIQTATVRYTTNLIAATAGTVTGASWTSGSPILTYTSSTVPLVVGMYFNAAGATAYTVKTINSPTQVTLSGNATSSGSGTITAYNATATTMVIGSAPAMDGRTLLAGDVILLTSQNVTATAGPWQVVTNTGTSLTLSRPLWFQGSLTQPIFIGLQQGGSGGGFVYTVGPQFGALGPISIGVDFLICSLTSSRVANAVVGANIFTGQQTFVAGTAAGVAPFLFQTGILNTTPIAGRVEWDGGSLYATNTSAIRKKFSFLEDGVVISATAPSAVVFDIENSEVVYHTTNTTADFSLNLRGSSTLTMNSILEANKARTVVLMVTNGTTAYKISTVSVDGTAQTVKWLGGSAPSNGNVSSIDSYSFTIIKTAANVYTVLGSFVRFA